MFEDMEIKLEIFAIPSIDKKKILNRMHIRDTNAALIVYDVDSKESMHRAQDWAEVLQEYARDEVCWSVAGNKMDIEGEHAVATVEGEMFSKRYKIEVFKEISCKNNEGVDDLFQAITAQCAEADRKL